jgi:uncharacterized protein (DUF433 family)
MIDIEVEIEERIVCDPEILSGKPVIRGTRIPVYVIIDYFWNGIAEAEIIDDYPHLSVADIRAALAFHLRLFSSPHTAEEYRILATGNQAPDVSIAPFRQEQTPEFALCT